MTICAFYEPLWTTQEADDRALLKLWSDSWQANGWQTRVLSLKDAKAHPLFKEFDAVARTFPTVNHRAYEQMCWLRHLAYALSGADLFSDYDIINRSWQPAPDDPKFQSPIHTFMNGGPCLYRATEAIFKQLLTDLMAYKGCIWKDKIPHASDLTAFLSFNLPRSADCSDYPQPGWNTAAMCHFGNAVLSQIKGGSKADKIRALRPLL